MTSREMEQNKQERIEQAAIHYAAFMDQVIPGWREDPQATDTPRRVAKSFINDLVKSLHNEPPRITEFDNGEKYDGIVAQCNIPVKSLCAHHHLPITGFAHVAYIPKPESKIIGLSKLNRLVEFWTSRPSTQEHMTSLIHKAISDHVKENEGVAVVIHASHMCCSHRGIRHDSEMHTARVSGAFHDKNDRSRDEFYRMIAVAIRQQR